METRPQNILTKTRMTKQKAKLGRKELDNLIAQYWSRHISFGARPCGSNMPIYTGMGFEADETPFNQY